jgi:hypothetical protein
VLGDNLSWFFVDRKSMIFPPNVISNHHFGDITDPPKYLYDENDNLLLIKKEDVWYFGNMAIILWIPPVKENNVIIEKGYFHKLVVPTSDFNQHNLTDVFQGETLTDNTNIVETGHVSNPVADDPEQEKTMSLKALSTKVLRTDGSQTIVPLRHPYTNVPFYQRMEDGDIMFARTGNELITKRMLEQDKNNTVISMGAFSLTGEDGITVTPYDGDFEMEGMTYYQHIVYTG